MGNSQLFANPRRIDHSFRAALTLTPHQPQGETEDINNLARTESQRRQNYLPRQRVRQRLFFHSGWHNIRAIILPISRLTFLDRLWVENISSKELRWILKISIRTTRIINKEDRYELNYGYTSLQIRTNVGF